MEEITNEERNIIDDLLYKTKIKTMESQDIDDLLTKEHTKFICEITYNKISYVFDYQCNVKYNKPTKENLLSCLVSDARCYIDCVVGSDEDNIQEFANMFGYDDIKKLLKAYKGCKKTYENLIKMYSEDNINLLYKYFMINGLI